MHSTESLAETADPTLRAMRLRSGMTLSELARRLDLDKGYLSRVERGVQQAPANTIARMADAVGRYQAEKSSAA